MAASEAQQKLQELHATLNADVEKTRKELNEMDTLLRQTNSEVEKLAQRGLLDADAQGLTGEDCQCPPILTKTNGFFRDLIDTLAVHPVVEAAIAGITLASADVLRFRIKIRGYSARRNGRPFFEPTPGLLPVSGHSGGVAAA